MTAEFRTDHVPAARRAAYWEQILVDTLMPLRGRHAGDLTGRLVTGEIGPVRVTEATTPAGECVRTPELIRRSSHDLYQVDVVTRGRVVVEQGGRVARLRPGDIAFIDPSRPVRYRTSATTHVSVLFARELMPLRSAEVARLTAERVPGDRGSGALVSSLARQLPRHLDDCRATEAARLGTTLIDMLRVALTARLHRGPAPTAGADALLASVYAFIDANLGDPDLSPATIAAAHHISIRMLHKLFARERHTVAAWIRHRRLDRSRADLLDPTQRNLPVNAIAARWGLPNAAHFSRAFKAEYGRPPAEYRGRR